MPTYLSLTKVKELIERRDRMTLDEKIKEAPFGSVPRLRLEFVVTQEGIFFESRPWKLHGNNGNTLDYSELLADEDGIRGDIQSGGIVDLDLRLVYSTPGDVFPYEPDKAIELLSSISSGWEAQDWDSVPPR